MLTKLTTEAGEERNLMPTILDCVSQRGHSGRDFQRASNCLRNPSGQRLSGPGESTSRSEPNNSNLRDFERFQDRTVDVENRFGFRKRSASWSLGDQRHQIQGVTLRAEIFKIAMVAGDYQSCSGRKLREKSGEQAIHPQLLRPRRSSRSARDTARSVRKVS